MKRVTWKQPTYPKPFQYEDAAWREIARQFAEPPPRTAPNLEPTRRGLCYAITQLYWRERISERIKRRMVQRVEQFVGSASEYAYEGHSATNADFVPHRTARSLACLWLALDSQIDP